jgi:hypothetical protein
VQHADDKGHVHGDRQLECTVGGQGDGIADPDAPADVNGGIVGADGRDKGHEQDVGQTVSEAVVPLVYGMPFGVGMGIQSP